MSREWLGALAIYSALVVWVTWPVLARPRSAYFGLAGDGTSEIAGIQARVEMGVGPLSSAVDPSRNYPFGVELNGVVNLSQLAIELPLQALADATGSAILGYNIVLLAGMVATPFAAYLLCHELTGHWAASVIGGVAFGFAPWNLEAAGGFLHLTHLASLPLILLALVLGRRGRTRLAWTLFTVAAAVGLYTHAYLPLMIVAVVVAFVLSDLAGALLARSRRLVGDAVARGLTAGGILLLLMVPQMIWFLSKRDAIDGALAGTRSPEDLSVYGARWHEWITPSHRHPVLHDSTFSYLVPRLHGSNLVEVSIYVGVSVLLLAALGLVVALARPPNRETLGAALLGVALAAVGFWMALPAEFAVGGVPLPTAAKVIGSVATEWRVYSRFAVITHLGLAILAATGAAALIRRPALRTVQASVAIIIGVVVFGDLAVTPWVTDLRTPDIYRVTGQQPPGARVEYPIGEPRSSVHSVYAIRSEAARRPLMNGADPISWQSHLHEQLADPSRPWTAPVLGALGIRYVVAHEAAEPQRYPPTAFRPVATRRTDRLYEITARPARGFAVAGQGFGRPEPTGDGGFGQWMGDGSGLITVYWRGPTPGTAELSFDVASFAEPRTLVVTQGDRTLARRRVGGDFERVSVRARMTGRTNRVRISSVEPAQSIGSVLGNDDGRAVTFRVQRPTVDWGAGALTLG